MKLIDEIALAKPRAVKGIAEATGCTEAEAEAAYDKSAKKYLAHTIQNDADRWVGQVFDTFLTARDAPELAAEGHTLTHKRP